jgi:hypothetical protein
MIIDFLKIAIIIAPGVPNVNPFHQKTKKNGTRSFASAAI